MTTELKWSPGHADIEGNELTDGLAKSAAKEAVSLSEETSVVPYLSGYKTGFLAL